MRHHTPPGRDRNPERSRARRGGKRTRPFLALLALALALPGALLAGARPAGATEYTITVGTTVDQAQDCAVLTAVVPCSLRWAIQEANNRPAGDHTTIILPEGVHTLARPAVDPAGDTNLTGDLDVTANVTIRGAGAATTIIDGAALDRVLDVRPGATLAISGATIRNGLVAAGDGGGIGNAGTLSLVDAAVTGNRVAGPNWYTFGRGGGIANTGALTLASTTIGGNTAQNMGGGVFNAGTMTLTGGAVMNNRAEGGGVGSYLNGNGGGIANTAALTLVGTTLDGNTANYSGGGIHNVGDVSATDTTVSNNRTTGTETVGGGGGIATAGNPTRLSSVTLLRARLVGNSSGVGGGLYSFFYSAVTLVDSVVDGNVALQGGGIQYLGPALQITGSAISNNRATSTEVPGGAGAGVVIGGAADTYSAATITNTTISHNDVMGLSFFYANVALRGVTIAANSGGIGMSDGTVGVLGTIVASIDPARNCTYGRPGMWLADLGANLETGMSCGLGSGPGSAANTDPQLLPLADNGGPTRTHALAPGSPAINRLPPGTACPATDQRGIARPQGAACDAGAFEAVVAALPPMPTFADLPAGAPATTAVGELARRAIVNGCDPTATPPLFCPNEETKRHQLAALIVRAMPGWAAETGLPTFTDNTADTELMTRVATLQRHGVVGGYNDCAAQGLAAPCYGPLDPVLRAQAISFVTRAMVSRGYWTQQPTNPALYGGALAGTGHEQDASTYWYYTRAKGGVPDYPEAGPFPVGEAAPRGWFARLLWTAIQGSPAAP